MGVEGTDGVGVGTGLGTGTGLGSEFETGKEVLSSGLVPPLISAAFVYPSPSSSPVGSKTFTILSVRHQLPALS
ncbi:MAG: hypothetical protein LBP53_00635 [Candidatus Peribacteria bacterium]|jgi:hypothetical protein|nr:hypothetical protein [Candidatus Peribacteria bacterium]